MTVPVPPSPRVPKLRRLKPLSAGSAATVPVPGTGTPTPTQRISREVADDHDAAATARAPSALRAHMHTSMTRRSVLSGAVAASAVALVGCSAKSDEVRLERRRITVGAMPIVDSAAVFLALDDGLFKAEGLEVRTEIIDGGAAGVPRLDRDLDLTFGNYVSHILAHSEERRLRIVADGYQAASSQGALALMVAPDTKIRTPADLRGHTVAINTRDNVVHLTTLSMLSVYRVDEDDVTFVEVPFPEMEDALKKGKVDAAVTVEPFITGMQRAFGAVQLADVTSGPTEALPIAAYASTASWAERHPNTTAAFVRAITRASQACADRNVVAALLPKYTKIDKQTAALVSIGAFPTSLNPIRVQRVADLMYRFGVLKKPFDATELIG